MSKRIQTNYNEELLATSKLRKNKNKESNSDSSSPKNPSNIEESWIQKKVPNAKIITDIDQQESNYVDSEFNSLALEKTNDIGIHQQNRIELERYLQQLDEKRFLVRSAKLDSENTIFDENSDLENHTSEKPQFDVDTKPIYRLEQPSEKPQFDVDTKPIYRLEQPSEKPQFDVDTKPIYRLEQPSEKPQFDVDTKPIYRLEQPSEKPQFDVDTKPIYRLEQPSEKPQFDVDTKPIYRLEQPSEKPQFDVDTKPIYRLEQPSEKPQFDVDTKPIYRLEQPSEKPQFDVDTKPIYRLEQPSEKPQFDVDTNRTPASTNHSILKIHSNKFSDMMNIDIEKKRSHNYFSLDDDVSSKNYFQMEL